MGPVRVALRLDHIEVVGLGMGVGRGPVHTASIVAGTTSGNIPVHGLEQCRRVPESCTVPFVVEVHKGVDNLVRII